MTIERFLKDSGASVPLIGGAMYPCSNPELVAGVSKAGGIGIVQPVSLTYAHGYDYREGLRLIRKLADGRPIGVNLLIEASSKKYLERNQQWLEIALEEGVRFFITALGDPRWVVERIKSTGAVVYHDVTARVWAEKAMNAGVNGLICVNNRAGGHAGEESTEALLSDLKGFGVPLVCAGGIGSSNEFVQALRLGYSGVQMGTRFIATSECSAHQDYKEAILKAKARDITLTRKITGVPVSVIKTDYIAKKGTETGPIASFLLKSHKTKHLARTFYALKSIIQLKKSLKQGSNYKDYWQAGKSVEHIDSIESCDEIIRRFEQSAQEADLLRKTC
jgi:nitronate monooxygenase